MPTEPLHDALNNWIPSEADAVSAAVAEALLIVDIANIIVFVSDSLTTMLGWSKADIVGTHLFELIIATEGLYPSPGFNIPEWSYYSAKLAAQHKVALKAQIASRTLHDMQGNVIGSFLIIVEQGSAEKASSVDGVVTEPTFAAASADRTSDEQLQSLIASMEDLIFAVDLQGHFLFYHQSAKSALRSTPLTPADAIIGKRFEAVLPEILSVQLEKAIRTVTSTLQIERVEYSLPENGEENYYSASVSPFFDTTIFKLLGVTVVVRDITEMVQYRIRQQHLYEFEQIQSAITSKFFQIDDPSTAVDELLPRLGAFLDVSCINLFKMRDLEPLMDNIYEWCSVGTQSQKAQSQGRPIEGAMHTIVSLLTRDRVIAAAHLDELPEDMRIGLAARHVQALIILPIFVDETLRGFVGVSDMYRPRRWLPEEISIVRSLSTNYGRAIERQQAQAALVLARDAALQSVKLKTEFMSNMSHEVRTPMTGMLGMLELLLETNLDSEQLEFVSAALSSSRHLLRILDDILDFAKSESGKLVFELKPVEIPQLVNEVLAIGQSHAANKPVRMVATVAPNTPRRVATDPTRLRQVLMNLVNNAVKFTSSGEVEVRVSPVSENEERVRLHFEVRDTGIGIPTAQLDNIFEPFVQADGSITRKYGGTGLGLAISRQIINLMGGELVVTSEQGKGSSFSFTVACAVIPDPTAAQAAQALQPAAEPADANVTKHRILIAEDNPTNQHLIKMTLQPMHCTVDIVENGLEALEKVQQQSYALVLMDIHMPEMDGIESTKRIRALGGDFANLPIIAVTASIMPEEQQKFIEAGMNGIIEKPFSGKRLRALVAKWVDDQKSE